MKAEASLILDPEGVEKSEGFGFYLNWLSYVGYSSLSLSEGIVSFNKSR